MLCFINKSVIPGKKTETEILICTKIQKVGVGLTPKQ